MFEVDGFGLRMFVMDGFDFGLLCRRLEPSNTNTWGEQKAITIKRMHHNNWIKYQPT